MRIPRRVRAALVALAIALTVGAPTASADDLVIRRDGSKAVYVPSPSAPPPASLDSADGFHLADAGIGAAGMLALVFASAGAVSVYGWRHPSRPAGAS